MLSSMFALYISVMINGQEWEAIPNVYDTKEACLEAEKAYTKDIVVESGCFSVEYVVRKEI